MRLNILPVLKSFASIRKFSSHLSGVSSNGRHFSISHHSVFYSPASTFQTNFLLVHLVRPCTTANHFPNNPSIQSKKRISRKRLVKASAGINQEKFSAVAYSSAKEYNMPALSKALANQGLYLPLPLPDDVDEVIHVTAKYKVDKEPRHLYFFSEGTVVFWNVSETEQRSVLKFLKPFQKDPYNEELVIEEKEHLEYFYSNCEPKLSKGEVLLNENEANDLECYAFSNAIALSVKLAIWEAWLQSFIDSMESLTDSMVSGKKIRLSDEELSKKRWQLFALRDAINLRSDLLDTPDFYWERENLEIIYRQTYNYFDIAKRTRVMNDRLICCSEPIEQLSSNSLNSHFIRLERMIIALILIEVLFDSLHFADMVYRHLNG